MRNSNNSTANNIKMYSYFSHGCFCSLGGLARSVVVTILAPLELMRTMQLGGAGHVTFTSLFSDIYSKHGVPGFYRGWASTIMRDTPFSILYWMCFERLRLVYHPLVLGLPHPHTATTAPLASSNTVHYSPVVNFLSGATSGDSTAVFIQDLNISLFFC
jgi:hypothetical protein